MNLKGKTIFISGASRGIGLAIVKKAAGDGANVAIAAKTTDPNPKLPGTIYSAAEEIERAGGKALPIQCDIRDEEQVVAAARKALAEIPVPQFQTRSVVAEADLASISATKRCRLAGSLTTRNSTSSSRATRPPSARAMGSAWASL